MKSNIGIPDKARKEVAAIIRQLRDDAPGCAKLGDDGTNDFLVGLMEEHE